MITAFSEKLHVQLQEELLDVQNQETDRTKCTTESLYKIRVALSTLRSYLTDHPFADSREEINFFKEIKPKFYSLYIYYRATHTIQTHKPVGSGKTIRNYYYDELMFINRFFEQHAFEYQYYRLKAIELDDRFFIRGNFPVIPVFPEIAETDTFFSSSHDYLFSKIRAYEMLREYLLAELSKLNKQGSHEAIMANEGSGMKWTGDAINLVELAYGLHLTGQINHGNAAIGEIIRWMEKSLDVQIGRPYRRFTEIKRRKRLSQTKYLDEMKQTILKKLDEEDVYLPKQKGW